MSRIAAFSGLVMLACSAGPAPPPARPAAEPPRAAPWNIVLITVDALRADRMSLYGHPRPTTPHLDDFAREAAVFENAFAVSAHTSPGVVSLLTGQVPPVHAQTTQSSHYDALIPSPLRVLAAQGYDVVGFAVRGATFSDLGFTRGLDGQPAEEFLAERAEDPKPFFAWLHTRETHLPYQPAPALAGRFTRGMPLDSPLLRAVREFTFVLRDARVEISYRHAGAVLASDADREPLRALYDECVASADAKLGAWLAQLRASGLLERTLVVITADHGDELLEHGWVGHASTGYDGKLTDEILHVPLILRLPSGAHAGRYRALVSQVDVMPTVFALLGLDGGALAPHQQGVSLAPVLRGARAEVRDFVYAETTRKGWTTPRSEVAQRISALRTRDRKLIVSADSGRDLFEAFDLAADPGETRNLWRAEADRFRDLRAKAASLWDLHERSAAEIVLAAAEVHAAEQKAAVAREDVGAVVARWRAIQSLHATWGYEQRPFHAAPAYAERWRSLRIGAADLTAAALRCDARGLALGAPECRDAR